MLTLADARFSPCSFVFRVGAERSKSGAVSSKSTSVWQETRFRGINMKFRRYIKSLVFV